MVWLKDGLWARCYVNALENHADSAFFGPPSFHPASVQSDLGQPVRWNSGRQPWTATAPQSVSWTQWGLVNHYNHFQPGEAGSTEKKGSKDRTGTAWLNLDQKRFPKSESLQHDRMGTQNSGVRTNVQGSFYLLLRKVSAMRAKKSLTLGEHRGHRRCYSDKGTSLCLRCQALRALIISKSQAFFFLFFYTDAGSAAQSPNPDSVQRGIRGQQKIQRPCWDAHPNQLFYENTLPHGRPGTR